MAALYRTVYKGGSGEIEEKKSRFISYVKGVSSEEEAAAFITEIKKKHWDARHNCSAFVLGKNREIMRSSDDGEPSGTAGKPILELLLKEELTDTVIVVTRYFGGTLLGTGGLIRAYTQAAKEGLRESTIIEKKQGIRLLVRADYTLEGKLRRFAAEKELYLEEPEYSERVLLPLIADGEMQDKICQDIVQLTEGKAEIEKGDALYYARAGRDIIFFEA